MQRRNWCLRKCSLISDSKFPKAKQTKVLCSRADILIWDAPHHFFHVKCTCKFKLSDIDLLFSGAFCRLLSLVHKMLLKNRVKTLLWNLTKKPGGYWKDSCQLWSPMLYWGLSAMCWAHAFTWGCVWLLTGSELGNVLGKAVRSKIGSKIFSPRDLIPWILQNFCGACRTLQYSWCTPSFSWGRAWCQHPFRRCKP